MGDGYIGGGSDVRNGFSPIRLAGLFLLAFFLLCATALPARAALQVSFSLQPSPAELSVGESGTWEITVTNPDQTPVNNATLTVTLPADYTVTDAGGGNEAAGPPHTMTWSNIDIPAGNTHIQSFKARPNCGAVDNQNMTAVIDDGSGPATASSNPIEIKTPALSMTMVDSNGNTVADASVGDVITWILTIDNTGNGAVIAGADITIDTGNKTVISITSSTGHTAPTPPYPPAQLITWNSGLIAAHSQAKYEIEVEISTCERDDKSHGAAVNWTDGSSTPCLAQPITSATSVNLKIKEPKISIEVTNPGPLAYCPGTKTRAQIKITNSGAGPAINCLMMMDNWPDTWKVIPVTSGLIFDDASNTFGIADIPAGDSLTFEFDIEPGSGCPVTDSATLLFLPYYTNECGETYGTTYYTPVVGPQTWTMAIPAPPTFTINKSGPASAEVGETGLVYKIDVTYTGPAAPLPWTVDITDTYPGSVSTGLSDGFVVTNITGGGVNDPANDTITWSDITFNAPGDTVHYEITMDAPTDPCAGFHNFCNQATVNSVPNDCQGCPGVIKPGEACTYINDTHGNTIAAASLVLLTPNPADVCSDLQFKTCYTADSSGAPNSWAGIKLKNYMSVPAGFTFVSIDSIKVNDTEYISYFSNPSFPLDLSPLDGNTTVPSAPKPSTGAELCVTYTYHVDNIIDVNHSSVDFRNISVLTAGGGSSCTASPGFNVAADFSVECSRMEVTAGGTPDLINTCETREYTIAIGGFRTLYDAKVTLNTENNYTYESTVSFSDVKDAAGYDITAFEPDDNGDGTYTWDFRTHTTGSSGDILPQGTITFKMHHSCNPNLLEWSAAGVYNNHCEDGDDGVGGNDPQKRQAPISTDAPLKVLDGEPTLHLSPAQVFANNPYPQQTVTIVNGGSGPLYNVALKISLDPDLIYLSSSVPSGSSGPDSIDVSSDHHTATLHYDKIDSGASEALDITLKLVGCTQLGINASLTWCDPDPTKSCDNVQQSSVVILPDSQVLIVHHSGDKFDYCNDQPATINIIAQNGAQADAYHTQIIEILPPGVTYITNSTTVTHPGGYGPLTGTGLPTITIGTDTSGTRQKITWDFSSILPLNNDSPQAKAMAPSSALNLEFQVEIDGCYAAAVYAASDKQASATATFDPPCNFEGTHPATESAAKILITTPYTPHITVVKWGKNVSKNLPETRNTVEADPGDIIEWRIVYTSNGDHFAKDVNATDTLPTNVTYVNGSGTVNGSTTLPDTWYTSGYNLGDMSNNASDSSHTHTIIYQTTVNSGGCTSTPTTNTAHAKYGCCSDPALKTADDSVNLRTLPDFGDAGGAINISHANWTRCGGEVLVTITNSGGTAFNDNIVVNLDPDYVVDGNGTCSTNSTNSTHTVSCPTMTDGNSAVTWGPGNIDKISPGETITIRFWVKTAPGACVNTDDITNEVDFAYHSTCSVDFTKSDSDNFTPPHPNVAIEITPVQQIVEVGDTATWTITLTNTGNAPAENLTLTDELGDGFSGPSDTQSGSWSGNTATWNPGTIAAGGSWSTTVTATVNSGHLSNYAHVIGKCQDRAGNDTCTYVEKGASAYVAAFSLDKSVDKTVANVGELLTYRVTAVFSNTDKFQNVEIVDNLPSWVEYVDSKPWSGSGGNNTLNAGTVSVVGSANATGQTLTWNPADFNGTKTFDYEITARILNNPANVSGTLLTNNATTTFDIEFPGPVTSSGFSLSKDAKTTVTEPKLSLTKSISPDSGLQAGDTVTITLVATNNGDGPAYNVNLSDLINDNNAGSNGIPDGVVDGNDVIVYDCATIAAVTTPPDFTFSVNGTALACSVNYTITGDNTIAAGNSRTFTFTVQIAPTMVTGSNYKNKALTEGWSLKPTDGKSEDIAYDRKTDAAATDQIGSEKVSNGKSLVSTSEPDSVTAGSNVAIGEVAEYRLSFAFPAGKTRAVVLVDELPSGLRFIPGSATLARDSLDITTGTNPGGINGTVVNTPVSVTLDNSDPALPKLDLGDVDNSSGAVAHLTLVLKCVTLNSSGNNAGTVLSDRIRMDWQDAAGTGYTLTGNTVDVKVVEPVPAIVKTATPTSAEGGDTITFTLEICNNASGNFAASAFDWDFTDPLPADYENPHDINIVTGSTGATVNATFTGTTLNGTIDQLDPGECVTIKYKANLIAGVKFGKTITNTAQFVTTSLPGINGTGNATPGVPGSDTGERTGSGSGSNDLRGSDSADVTTNIPGITKAIVTPQTWYAIGEVETFKLTLGIPVGTTSNFVVTDTLPAGLVYVNGSQNVTAPSGFTSTKPPTFSSNNSTRELKWDFGNVTQTGQSADLVITYDVKVENVIGNQDGTTLTNHALLTYGNSQSAGPVTQTMTVGEPDLYLEKTPQTTPVGLEAGDTLRYRVEFKNNGHTTAYQMDWKDVLPNPGSNNGLYKITNPALTIVSGDVFQNNTTTPLSGGDLVVSTTNGPAGNNDTIALPYFSMTPGSHFQVEFDCQLMPLVRAGETLTNETAVSYASLVSGNHTTGVRDCEKQPCDDDNNTALNNYGESASSDLTVNATIAIVKTLVGGNDKFTIGEEFAYNLRTWVIEGVSPDVEVHDNIPSGLTLQGHSISTPGIGIISFSNPGYNTPSGNVIFAFGNVTNLDNNVTTDDHFDVELTVKVDNIAANQDGVKITNNALVRWSPVGNPDTDVPSGNVTVQVIEPVLEVSKTVSPTTQASGDLVIYTVTVNHASASTDDAYDLVINDTLPVGLTFISATQPNLGSGQNLKFQKASLLQGETWQFSYTVRVDAGTASGTLTNDLDLKWSSIPGADGSEHSGRDGSNCGQASPLNDYCNADNATLKVVVPGIKLEKTVYLGHDSGASCSAGVEKVSGVFGKEITYCFVVTNTGDAYLNDITFADGDLGITKTDLTLIPGSSDPLPLAPGKSRVYYYQSSITGDLTNTAGVNATPTDSGGTPIPGASRVTDTDTAQVDMVAPDIELAKTVYYGHDSGASAPGGELTVGSNGAPVTYCFTVKNTGDTYLNDITIDDAALGINATSLTLKSGTLPLAVNATLVYYYETTITGDLTNNATVTGNPTDSSGTDLPQVPSPRDSDTARVVVASPGIDLQKTVYLGHDGGASCPGGELVTGVSGKEITYCFTVENTGDTYLDDITINDADLGINTSSLTLKSGTLPLAPGGTLVYYYETTITRDLTNTATATGNPTDSHGIDLPGFPDPTATDTAQVDQVGPGIEIQKTVYLGHDSGASCSAGVELVSDIINAPVTYCFVVTNTGDTWLTGVTLKDPSLGLDLILTPGPLAPNNTVSYHYETTINGDLTNTATATGNPTDSHGTDLPQVPDPTDSDTAAVDQLDPAIELVKTVYEGHDGGTSCPGQAKITVGLVSYTPPDCPTVIIPTKITYCFTVKNTGGTYLDDLTIVDNDLKLTLADLKPISGQLPLAPGDSISYYYESSISASRVNHAEASAQPVRPDGTPLPLPPPSSNSTAEVVVDPAIPTLGEWGLIILMLLASFSLVYYRRRREGRIG